MANVALLAEGVDRNGRKCTPAIPCTVALLAEGVDRNWQIRNSAETGGQSPSSRRAWIEILISTATTFAPIVALLAEGVDRNLSLS